MIGKKIVSGFFWNIIEQGVKRGASFIIKIFLARLLFPEDFGLIGMAIVFISIIQVFNDVGMNAALIQRKDELLNDYHYHTSFWSGVVWSISIYLLLFFFLSPLIADFYNEPQLVNIVRVLSLSILFSPITSIQLAILTKKLDFKKLSLIQSSTDVLSGIIAIGLAFFGAGVWALVVQAVLPNILRIPLLLYATKYSPKFKWNLEAFKDVFSFGVFTMGSSLFIKVTSQFDYLLVGKWLGKSDLGIYTFAFILTEALRSQLINIFTKVLYPIFSKFQDDLSQQKKYYYTLLNLVSYGIIPLMFIILFFSKDLILIFGEKWLEAVPIVRIFAVSVIIHLPLVSTTAMIRGSGYPKLEFRFQLFKALLLYIPLIVVGTYYYGILGTAIAHLISKILTVITMLLILKKQFNIRMFQIWENVKNGVLIGLIPFLLVGAYKNVISDFLPVLIFLFLLLLAGSFLVIGRRQLMNYINILKTYKAK